MITIHELTSKKLPIVLGILFIIQVVSLVILVLIYMKFNNLNNQLTTRLKTMQMQRQMQNNGGSFGHGSNFRGGPGSQLQPPSSDPLQGL